MTAPVSAALDQPQALQACINDIATPEIMSRMSAAQIFSRLMYALHHPSFGTMPVIYQGSILRFCTDLAMAEGLLSIDQIDQVTVAVSKIFRQFMNRGVLDLAQALHIYDGCRCAFAIINDNGSIYTRFDEEVVKPFGRYLKKKLAAKTLPTTAGQSDAPLRVCYFANFANLGAGQAVAPVVATLARLHSRLAGQRHQVLIYAIYECTDDYRAHFEDSGIPVRSFADIARLDQRAQAVLDAVREDKVDVIISDLNTAVASYVFQARAAPLQTWIETGQPAWSLSEVDWTVMIGLDYQHYFGIDPKRHGRIPIHKEPALYDRPFDRDAVRQVRSLFPEDAKVFGVFVRLIKITDDYLASVESILMRNPKAHMLITGIGDARRIETFRASSPIGSRVTLINRNIDVNVHGRAIDVFLDTFPFIGASSGLEVSAYGKPAVAIFSEVFRTFLTVARDPRLVVGGRDEYEAIAERLIRDEAFYADCSSRARELGLRPYGDPEQGPNMLIELIDRLWRERAHSAPTAVPAAAAP